MTAKRRPRKNIATGALGFLRNLSSGDMGPVERTRSIAGNFYNRYFGRRTLTCCGNYGDPGC